MKKNLSPQEINTVKQHFILALDMPSQAKAEEIIEQTKDYVGYYKIGLGFLALNGIDFAASLAQQGYRIFLDLKLFDIGQTITDAVARLSEKTQASILTVHGDQYVVAAALKGRNLSGRSDLQIFAVTVLTSIDISDLNACGFQGNSVIDIVSMRARYAAHAGADGVIASAHEVSAIKNLGYGLKIITPGVRSQGAITHDQKRVMTPQQALYQGSDQLVIGREVTQSENPAHTAQTIFDSIAEFKFLNQ